MNGLSKVSVRITISLLIIIELCSLFLVYKSFSNRKINEIKDINTVNSNKFAMYIEQDDGSYSEYTEGNLFTIDGYIFNLEKSNCVDNKGNIVNDALTNNGNKITISSNKTSYCYLYFSLPPNLYDVCGSYDKMSSCVANENISQIEGVNSIEAGMYRYQGTDAMNYVCFGTTVKSECVGNTDAYMYRIIGIRPNGQMKLIKKEALNTGVKWWDNYTDNIEWPSSNIYTTLNGNDYLLNETYVLTGWESKIATTSWYYGDTTTNGNYDGATMYPIENPFGESTASNRFTKTVSAKIGLMYIHDFYYAYASGGAPGSSSNAVTAWIHLSKNDTSAPIGTEWPMSRYGLNGSNGYYYAWRVYSNGYVTSTILNYAYSVRPVFYLTSDVEITGGTGILTDPFLIN
ncbi:MAG: hypothetical protein IJN13_01625 [Bacilli bacterium]|nr:hypothetical protein [Bacilli bacterium]